jgi:hypothetical protein
MIKNPNILQIDGRKSLNKLLIELANKLKQKSYYYHSIKDNPHAVTENTWRAGQSEAYGYAASALQKIINKKGVN